MERKERTSLPKDFFSLPRPKVSTKEALEDVVPIKWSRKVEKGKKKTIVYSTKERKVL